MLELKLDLLQTLSLAALVYFTGMLLRRRVAWLDRLNIPAAVIGGLLFTTLVMILRDRVVNISLETSAQSLFSVAFFTTIGMGASLSLLRAGGIQVAVFLGIATAFCLVQNFVGMWIAQGFGEHPLLGVMAGSVTLVGGPATGLAFAPVFEAAGLPGAAALALTAATFGIVCGGLIGGPVGTRLIRRSGLSGHARPGAAGQLVADADAQAAADLAVTNTFVVEVDREDTNLVRNLVWLAVAMLLGSVVSRYITSFGVTLPAYIGAMLVASVVRNVDDATGWFRIDEQVMEFVGNLALSIFLVVALMDLKLWQLAGQAMPLFVILLVQVAMVGLFALTLSFRIMGRDYDSAVMASGFVGFALGTTANAVANMRALVLRYGPAPRAFLVVPLVGAFFIDFTNAIIITLYVNWLK
jgi:ESS family glutamate:Na+ symporter